MNRSYGLSTHLTTYTVAFALNFTCHSDHSECIHHSGHNRLQFSNLTDTSRAQSLQHIFIMDPAEIAALDGGVTEKRNRVILRNIPEGLTAQGIRNALKPYGHVVNMHQAGNNLAFATFETAA